MNETKILVVDDEPSIRKLLQRGLTSYGYEVNVADNGAEALNLAAREHPDLLVLDINLGSGLDGIEVCRQLREWSSLPVIMLSVKEEMHTKLEALNAGADDYMVKPFGMDELEARIRAVLRRAMLQGADSASGEIHVHDLTIDLVRRRVFLKDEEVHLTPKEYDLLRLLATNAGKVLTTQSLFLEIWGEGSQRRPEHNVRVYINTLRKKLGDDPTSTSTPRYIFNEPGIGYRFTDV